MIKKMPQIQIRQEYTRNSGKNHRSWSTLSVLIPYSLQECNLSNPNMTLDCLRYLPSLSGLFPRLIGQGI